MQFPCFRQSLTFLTLVLGLSLTAFSGMAGVTGCPSGTVASSGTGSGSTPWPVGTMSYACFGAEPNMSIRVLNYTEATITNFVVYRGGDVHPNTGNMTGVTPYPDLSGSFTSDECDIPAWSSIGGSGYCWRTSEWKGNHWIASLNPVTYNPSTSTFSVDSIVPHTIPPIRMNDPPPGNLQFFKPANDGYSSTASPQTSFQTWPLAMASAPSVTAAKAYYDTNGRSPYMSIVVNFQIGDFLNRCRININATSAFPIATSFSYDITAVNTFQCVAAMPSNGLAAVVKFSVQNLGPLQMTLVFGCTAGGQYPCNFAVLSKSVNWITSLNRAVTGCQARKDENDILNRPNVGDASAHDYNC